MIVLLMGLAAWAQESPWGSLDDAPAQQPTRVSAAITVSVGQREEAADALVSEAKALGGWFQSRTGDGLSLRVPVSAVDGLLDVATSQGKVVDRSITRQDVGQEIADVAGRLSAREEVLERYYEVLEEAGPESVVAVETQIVQAIERIEALRGRLRVLQDQAAYGRVDVSFRFRQRSAPTRDGTSSFRWLNTLNVQDVLDGHRTLVPAWRTRAVDVPAPPDGFSAWRREAAYRAASPDDVLFRVRSEKHKPEASLAFWKEAVRERMIAAGYSVQAEEKVTAGTTEGGLIELAAPLGVQDWTYLVAFFPLGGRMVVVEAAGEISRFEPRRSAILKAVEDLSM